MESLRSTSLNLLLLTVAGDSHSDCDPAGQGVSMPPLLSSPLLMGLTRSAGGKCPALPTSDPALGLTCAGKLGLFLTSTAERPHRWWESEKKGCKARPACSSGSAAIAFFGSYTSHCSGLFFKLFYFLYYAQTFSFPHRDGRCQGLTPEPHAHKGATAPSFLIFPNS